VKKVLLFIYSRRRQYASNIAKSLENPGKSAPKKLTNIYVKPFMSVAIGNIRDRVAPLLER